MKICESPVSLDKLIRSYGWNLRIPVREAAPKNSLNQFFKITEHKT
jgi:hypothetical protein